MPQKNLSPEDRLDGVYRTIAFLLLVIGFMYVFRALQFVLPRGGWFTDIGQWVRYAVLVVVPALSALTFWRSFSFKRACAGCSLMARGGFVFAVIQKSALRAAFVMWPALALLQAGADEPTLPAKFYLSIALAILTLTFSISYLVSSYVGGADE